LLLDIQLPICTNPPVIRIKREIYKTVFLLLKGVIVSKGLERSSFLVSTLQLESDPDYTNVSDLNMVSAEQTEEPEEQEDLV